MERCDTCQYVEGLLNSHWGNVSLRNFYLSFFLQAFTRKSNKPEDSRNSKEIKGVGCTLDFLEIS